MKKEFKINRRYSAEFKICVTLPTFLSVYLKYVSPGDIHLCSIDEVFIDATSYLELYKLIARDLATKIVRDIFLSMWI